MNNSPIGFFDSGVGGLTVARAVLDQLPHEQIIYVGDTAHVPYGTKTLEQVRRYSLAIMDNLANRGVKMLVIACNTASSAVLAEAQERYDIPVIGVIEPAVRAALAVTKNHKVGVIATPATVCSGAYEKTFAQNGNVKVYSQAAPGFVDLVESGVTSGLEAIDLAHTYLDEIRNEGVDTLVLGCTHYPHLQAVISYVMGGGVTLVSSSDETAKDIFRQLAQTESFRDPQLPKPKHEFYTTGTGETFSRLASRFLGPVVEQVDILPPSSNTGVTK
ncbi:glutamate racemase [Boudabousia tangfeifanii]|uniref:Glutamate racemase n=2 Tax=Boudabousia tangfeifanii TaxID=1912795 RepID=A0A1D9MMP5_9ACTO|nr:glutamate racemase [Boudabousia tangfeifanii]AOZ73433.1 glutamate racemase [Boudabousia tangfeifanii]